MANNLAEYINELKAYTDCTDDEIEFVYKRLLNYTSKSAEVTDVLKPTTVNDPKEELPSTKIDRPKERYPEALSGNSFKISYEKLHTTPQTTNKTTTISTVKTNTKTTKKASSAKANLGSLGNYTSSSPTDSHKSTTESYKSTSLTEAPLVEKVPDAVYHIIERRNFSETFKKAMISEDSATNILSDFCIHPIFSYERTSENGFLTYKAASLAYEDCLAELYERTSNVSYDILIFQDLRALLFPAVDTDELSNARKPYLYTFLEKSPNYIFNDERDTVLLSALAGYSTAISKGQFTEITKILARGVVKRIHEKHKEQVKELENQFIDKLAELGLTLSDVGNLNVFLNSLLQSTTGESDFLTALQNNVQNFPETFMDYIRSIGTSTDKFLDVVRHLIDLKDFTIRNTPEDYMIKDEIETWIEEATKFNNITSYHQVKYISYGKTLASILFMDDERDAIDAVLQVYAADAEKFYQQYLEFLSVIIDKEYPFSGNYLELHRKYHTNINE